MGPTSSAAAAAAVDADREKEAAPGASTGADQVNNQPAEVSRSANGTDGAALAHHEGTPPCQTQQTAPQALTLSPLPGSRHTPAPSTACASKLTPAGAMSCCSSTASGSQAASCAAGNRTPACSPSEPPASTASATQQAESCGSASVSSSPACPTFPAEAEASRAVDAKRESTAIARAALAGVTVHRSQTEAGRVEWIASRWALTRAFSSLDELERWLDMVTGQASVGAGVR